MLSIMKELLVILEVLIQLVKLTQPIQLLGKHSNLSVKTKVMNTNRMSRRFYLWCLANSWIMMSQLRHTKIKISVTLRKCLGL